MLLQRVLTAVILAPLAVAVIVFPPTWLFALVVAAVFLAAEWEWTGACGLRSVSARAAMLAFTLALLAVLWWARLTPWLWLAVILAGVAWWLVSLTWLRGYTFAASPSREHVWLKLAVGLCIFIPAWVALTTLHAGPQGHGWVLLALCIVWAADIGAYFSGRLLGRRKLAPRISPGKTRAGAGGALVAGMLVAAFGGWLLDVRGGWLVALAILGAVTVAASIIGDLFESLMKRHAEIKDSGTLLPGHGGLLDRMDSVFAAIPVFVIGKLVLGL
ncbi:MAG TPA: phosphatidate cytidylyltransferase [Oleiagrimonas sp.]|nr:phosphatidate cytidylyltransferase [Oleiagrimonas sp.]